MLSDQTLKSYAENTSSNYEDTRSMAIELMQFREQKHRQMESWKDAPEWAQWRAMDSDHRMHYYQEEPVLMEWEWKVEPRHMDTFYIMANGSEWQHSLEARPS